MENKIKYAKYAGIVYLLIAIIAPIAMMYIPSQLISNSSITETIKNIMGNQLLFSLGIGIETIVCLLEIVLSVILYTLFKEINATLSTIALVSRLSMTIIQAINALASLTVIGILTSSAMNGTDVNSVIFALLKYKELGVMIWQIFFGLHLIILGYLVYKSNYVARFFGILLSIASLGYLADSYFTIFQLNATVFSTIGSFLLVISTLGEVAITFRFLLKKINLPNLKQKVK
ncbi:DUF4386 domain-containing protein [Enterococcus termitis]|uniref:DUF4386 domain-containing protein n=1 Tax=Enterococcus termitis TaxID=332950 RepID=A0A1E5GYH2_9ENTE|nr:DUF4386 domain-containing protein [Enterococcus termitis]OEG17727.1 hypothetical protein BCR25_17790 [Enterococcus termitis]OJG96875.1 hypothetical protein RV18_GL001813 [Enterococcus termitis]